MNTGKTGTVYLVGSGPGDDRLLTLRALDLLKTADTVVYDNLVNSRLIDNCCPSGCERIYVGKSGRHHTMEQDDINALLVEKALEGRDVVRLKGGDPFIFGRGGEEALVLSGKNIPFEVVSGISSAYAVPACAGIPVTHRGFASSVAFITGHEDPEKETSDIHWDRIATGIQTLVFLMGVKNLPHIVKKLMENGRSGDTPVAVIQNGSYPNQRTVSGPLSDITGIVRESGIRPPSIIVVGEVVSLRNKINWFESRPLFGRSIIVTRAREQASKLVSQLGGLGAEVIEVPSIAIMPPDDTGPLYSAINRIKNYDWIIFTSANGVSSFYRYLYEAGLDSRSLCNAKICAIGPATADELGMRGINPDLTPVRYISSAITEALAKSDEISGKSFLLPRADIAPDTLRNDLLNLNAKSVDDITVYRTVKQDIDTESDAAEIIRQGKTDLVTFTSSSTVTNFHSILEQVGGPAPENFTCAAIGPVTAERARELGFNVAVTADEYTVDGLVRAILEEWSG